MIEGINVGVYKFGLTIVDASINNEALASATVNAAALYKLINLVGVNTYYGYEILITVIWNLILFYIYFIYMKKSMKIAELLFFIASVAVLNVFDFCLAKEPMQMLYFIMFFAVNISNVKIKTKHIINLIIFLLCAVTYRNYYILMIIFYLLIYIFYKFFLSKSRVIGFKKYFFLLIIIYLIYFLFLNATKVVYPLNFNELIQVRLRQGDATTTINPIFNNSNIPIFTLEYLLVALRMLFPIELIKLGPKYFIYAFYQLAMTFIVLKKIKNIRQISINSKLAILVYVSFFLASATFEPDFGSWVRHEAVLFPVFIIIDDLILENKIGLN